MGRSLMRWGWKSFWECWLANDLPSFFFVQRLSPVKLQGNLRRLQRRPLRGRMGGGISGQGNEDVASRDAVGRPEAVLLDGGFEHLEGVEVGVFAKNALGEGGDQGADRMIQ